MGETRACVLGMGEGRMRFSDGKATWTVEEGCDSVADDGWTLGGMGDDG